MYDTNFHTMGYLYLALALSKRNFILLVPLTLTAFLETGEYILKRLENIRIEQI